MNKSQTDIFFTVIVPTRERSDTLVHTIQTALSQDYDNFEVLVSDNASCDNTSEVVQSIKNPRLRYIRTNTRVSMSDNWEFALGHVKRGWVTILGDDDAILSGALKYVNQIAKDTGTKIVRSNGCHFVWPSLNGSSFGWLGISIDKGYEIRNSRGMLQNVINGKKPYSELPVLYNGGFVSIELLDEAKSKSGRVFKSLNPDVYSGVMLSLIAEQYVYSFEPLSINGASSHSGGTAGFERVKRTRTYDPSEKFWAEKNIPFHRDLPVLKNGRPPRSIPLYIYEAYLQAKEFDCKQNIKAVPKKQLALIMATSGPNQNEIEEWSTEFAKRYNISKRDSTVDAIFLRYQLFVCFIITKGVNLFRSYSLRGCNMLGLKNVYEAAIAASVIKRLQPTVVAVVMRHIKNRGRL